ncbi:porin [Candidatus Pantoea edessiphila]|uniref:Porin n=1 Tax=Candidatus Pantoea edessiphila TaxID=2044610 RepID=A0A2P5SWZ8_9GAMM|nr:porin [Candidatus Pantoea edessiphila]PPI86856.1 hypothetical protein CRV10_01215 [Candidatus Pantoea edessiphila]
MVRQKIFIAAMLTILINGATNAVEVYNKNNTKLDLYGKIDGLHYFTPNAIHRNTSFNYRSHYFVFNFPHGEDNTGIDKSRANFGFKVESLLDDKIIGYGQLQYQSTLDSPETTINSSSNANLGFVGFKFPFGSIDYGRNYGIISDVSKWTNILPEFGGSSEYTDNFLVGRNSGLLTYRNKNFFGLIKNLDFAVQYQSQRFPSFYVSNFNGNTLGISVSYVSPMGLGISAAYGNSTLVNQVDKPSSSSTFVSIKHKPLRRFKLHKFNKANNSHPNNLNPNDSNPNNSHPNNLNPNDSHPNNSNPNDWHPNDWHPNNWHPNNLNPNDSHPNNSNPNDSHPNNSNPNDWHPNDWHPNNWHPNNLNPNDSHPNNSNPNNSNPNNSNPNNWHPVYLNPNDWDPNDSDPTHWNSNNWNPSYSNPNNWNPNYSSPNNWNPSDWNSSNWGPNYSNPNNWNSNDSNPNDSNPNNSNPNNSNPNNSNPNNSNPNNSNPKTDNVKSELFVQNNQSSIEEDEQKEIEEFDNQNKNKYKENDEYLGNKYRFFYDSLEKDFENNNNKNINQDSDQNDTDKDFENNNNKNINQDSDQNNQDNDKNINTDKNDKNINTDKNDKNINTDKNDKNINTDKNDKNINTDKNDKNINTDKNDKNINTDKNDKNINTDKNKNSDKKINQDNNKLHSMPDHAIQWSAAIKYDKNNVYFAAMYGETYTTTYITDPKTHFNNFADKVRNFEIVAQYKFDFGFRPSVAYVESKFKNTKGNDTYIYRYLEIGATYDISKNMSTYVDYRINQTQPDRLFNFNGPDNVLAIGLVYKF